MLTTGLLPVKGNEDKTHFEEHFEIVNKVKQRLEAACSAFDGDEKFPRGM